MEEAVDFIHSRMEEDKVWSDRLMAVVFGCLHEWMASLGKNKQNGSIRYFV